MIYGAQPTGIMATMPMPAQAAMGQFAITDPNSPMGIESLAGGQEELAERLRAMGVPQYGLGSLFRKVVPKELRKVANVVIPAVLIASGNAGLAAAYSAASPRRPSGTPLPPSRLPCRSTSHGRSQGAQAPARHPMAPRC